MRLVAAGTDEWQAPTTLRAARTRVAVEVERPGLPTAVTRSSWTVSPSSPRAIGPARPTTDRTTLWQRPLEPMLEPIAIVGAAGLGLCLLVCLSRPLVLSAGRRTSPTRLSAVLRPGKLEQ